MREKWDGLSVHPRNIRPDCDPGKTPRLRRGPRPQCACDLPTCMYCRRKAAQRRYYQNNREAVKQRTAINLKLWRERQVQEVDAEFLDDLDRKALEMLKQEGLR